jgi:8-oxo-dGTP pyrophosphatase MutT (NUDIX family)
MKQFKNKPNPCHTLSDCRMIWESRSVAVVAAIVVHCEGEFYILAGKRGTGSDNIGKWNIPCGYIDYDESGTEALFREVYEETGLDLEQYVGTFSLVVNNLEHPWFVNTNPNENRQNISLRYGCVLHLNELPILSSENSEPNEVEELQWIHEDEIEDYDSAFNHNEVIKTYLNSFDISHLL